MQGTQTMQAADIGSTTYPVGRRTNHILIIDDNAQIRSLLARHILFSCREVSRSCALFHITETAQSVLTFFEPISTSNNNPELDFAIYEANSPRQALNWLQVNALRRLTIVSDVMMPVDTEVGLEGLLDGLSEIELPVSILFVSSETQNKDFVQRLIGSQQAYFVTKGGENWSKLPNALVKNIEALPYRVIRREGIMRAAKPADTKITEAIYPVATSNFVSQVKLQPQNMARSTMIGASEISYSAPDRNPKPGFWARLMQLFRS